MARLVRYTDSRGIEHDETCRHDDPDDCCSYCGAGIRWCKREHERDGEACCGHCDCEEKLARDAKKARSLPGEGSERAEEGEPR